MENNAASSSRYVECQRKNLKTQARELQSYHGRSGHACKTDSEYIIRHNLEVYNAYSTYETRTRTRIIIRTHNSVSTHTLNDKYYDDVDTSTRILHASHFGKANPIHLVRYIICPTIPASGIYDSVSERRGDQRGKLRFSSNISATMFPLRSGSYKKALFSNSRVQKILLHLV